MTKPKEEPEGQGTFLSFAEEVFAKGLFYSGRGTSHRQERGYSWWKFGGGVLLLFGPV